MPLKLILKKVQRFKAVAPVPVVGLTLSVEKFFAREYERCLAGHATGALQFPLARISEVNYL